MQRNYDQEWLDLENQINGHYTQQQWNEEPNEKSFLLDVINIAKKGDTLTALSILEDIVKINFSRADTTPSITCGNNPVSEPAFFSSMVEKIKARGFDQLRQRELSEVQEYVNTNPTRPENVFLSEILAKLNKDSTHEDYASTLQELSSRITESAPGVFSKKSLVYQDSSGKKHRIKDVDGFKAAQQKISTFSRTLMRNLAPNQEHTKTVFFQADSSGAINTPALSNLNGSGDQPNNLECNAAINPGCSLKDITRDTRIGSKSSHHLRSEVIDENPLIREHLNIPKEMSTLQWIEEKVKEDTGDLGETINNAAIASGQLGPDPFHDKLLFIKILSELDQGLHINSSDVYEAYEKLYDICFEKFKDQPQKVVNTARDIVTAARKLLVAHSRDYREIVKLKGYREGSEYYYAKPLIFSGTRIGSTDESVKIFDQRDNKAMINYLNEYKSQTEHLLPGESQAIERIQDFLRYKDNSIVNNTEILEQFKMFVEARENMRDCRVEIADQLIVNQPKRYLEEMQRNLAELKRMGASDEDIQDIQAAIDVFNHERNKLIQTHPEQIAVKEELLSLGQLMMNNFYVDELNDAITIHNEPVNLPAEKGRAEMAFVFKDGQAFYTIVVGNSAFMTEPGNLHVLRDENGPQKDALTMCATIHISADSSDTTQRVPPTKTTLTNLALVSTSPEIHFRSASEHEMAPAKEVSANLTSKAK